eukprot:1835343-Alexandrium_andersonii.AAC.1
MENEPRRARVNMATAAHAASYTLIDSAVLLPESAHATSEEPDDPDAAHNADSSVPPPTTFTSPELDDCLQAIENETPGWGILDSGCTTSLATMDAAN